jgi:hypothetical protein
MRKEKLNGHPPTRCDLCSRKVDELQPFDHSGCNPIKLKRTHRVLVPTNNEMEAILAQVVYAKPHELHPYTEPLYNDLWRCLNFKELEALYGREKLHQAYVYSLMANTVVVFNECKDCLALSNKRFVK